MNYGQQIISILCEAGEPGLTVHKIAMHVHGRCSTLFDPLRPDDVRRAVQAWLLRNSRTADAPVCRCAKRGVYRINHGSSVVRQLMLDFGVGEEACEGAPGSHAANGQETVGQPSLFDEMQ